MKTFSNRDGRHEFATLQFPRLLANFACDVSGLLFDLDYRDDLAPYLVGHRRLKQIRQHPALLVYADPLHCDGDAILSRIRLSLDRYSPLANDPADNVTRLGDILRGTGYGFNPEGSQEVHRIVLFSSAAPADPLAFLTLTRALRGDAMARRLDIDLSVDMVYVLPEYRCLGYGTALCVAAGICCGWEIRHQVERYAGYALRVSPRFRAAPLLQKHPRLVRAAEAKIHTMMERDMEVALSRAKVCLEMLRR
jgi:GNAT superfamily N-acetyltransferase